MSTPPLKTGEPFHFYTRVHLRELTGIKARNLRELLEHIRTVPEAVIYHHTHHFLQQHQYLTPEPPNDFAYWTREALNDIAVSEKLASINTCDFGSLHALRDKIAETIENHLAKNPRLREANEGQEFYFLKSVSFILSTPYTASSLEEFVEALKKITNESIYFHMFEAKLRLKKGTNDFSLWLESLGETELAKKIVRLDPYTLTMEALRTKIIRLVETRIEKLSEAKPAAVRQGNQDEQT